MLLQIGSGGPSRARQDEDNCQDENTCQCCLDKMEDVLNYKFKGYRNFRRQFDRIVRVTKLMGEQLTTVVKFKMFNLSKFWGVLFLLLFLKQ